MGCAIMFTATEPVAGFATERLHGYQYVLYTDEILCIKLMQSKTHVEMIYYNILHLNVM